MSNTYYIVHEWKIGSDHGTGWTITVTNMDLQNPHQLESFIESQMTNHGYDNYIPLNWRLLDDYEVDEPSGEDIIP